MPSPYPSRSPVSLPGARRCRLARRLAAGLTPAEVAEVEATTEEEIEAFVADHEFSKLVAQYRAARELPFDEQERVLIETAMADLQHLVDMGDRRALLFIVYEANRGRSPARRLVQLVRRTFEQATEPRAVRPAATAPPEQPRDSMAGYGQHPLGPAHAAAPRLADFIGAEAGRAALREAARETAVAAEAPAAPSEPAPVAEVELPALSWSASGEPIAPPGYRVVWVPRHPGVPDLPDELPLSPIAQLAHDFPDVADWFLRRGEQRLAELARDAADPDRPKRSAGQKPLGPQKKKVFSSFFVTLGLDPRAHGPTRRGVASVSMDPRIKSEDDKGGA